MHAPLSTCTISWNACKLFIFTIIIIIIIIIIIVIIIIVTVIIIVNIHAYSCGAFLASPVALLDLSLSLTHLQQILDGLIHDLEGSHIHGLHLCWQPPLLDLQEQTLHQCCAQSCSKSVVRCFVFLPSLVRCLSKPICANTDKNTCKATMLT